MSSVKYFWKKSPVYFKHLQLIDTVNTDSPWRLWSTYTASAIVIDVLWKQKRQQPYNPAREYAPIRLHLYWIDCSCHWCARVITKVAYILLLAACGHLNKNGQLSYGEMQKCKNEVCILINVWFIANYNVWRPPFCPPSWDLWYDLCQTSTSDVRCDYAQFCEKKSNSLY